MLNRNRSVGPKKFVFIAIITLLLSYILLRNTFTQENTPSVEEVASPAETEQATPQEKPVIAANKPTDAVSTTSETTTTASLPTEKTEAALSPKQIMLIRAQSKSLLATVYMGEVAFFQKHNRYTTDLKAIGYEPLKGTKFFAKFGFIDAFNSNQNIANESTHRKNSDAFISDELKYMPQAEGIELEKIRSYCQTGCSATNDKFEIILATNLDGDKDLDLWTINERKEMIHVFDDLAP